ncbi:putative aminopeptidase [Candidatus Vecturithrix granuli]|uniref:Putative aminopeptidase n=1 Tax=Vecturithrix granuli TaxID=1499967 RepID=A0A0S6W9U3_VECG1|nr:putative aminopeptidase [Candidatus Vecturithrix granuli]
MNVQERIKALRELMQQHNIDAWIAPSADPHQSEYPAECWKSRAWISGFTGSAGTVVITQKKAGLWTDSRYYLQADRELAGSGIALFKIGQPDTPSYSDWLAQELREHAVIGFDGQIFSAAQGEQLQKAVSAKQIQLVYQQDLIAQIWQDRPAMPAKPVMMLELEFAGESRASKVARIRERLQRAGSDAHFISALDDIAWMFNIRGSDVEYNPVTIAYTYISQDEVRLFIDSTKLSAEVQATLRRDNVVFSEYEEVWAFLQKLPQGTRILIDPEKTSLAVKDVLSQHCTIKEEQNIAFTLKAQKNEIEVQGIRHAHVRDGVAMVKWLYWLDQHIDKEEYTEYTVVNSLHDLRSQQQHFQGLSFHPIAGYQANAALCHYRPEPKTALKIRPEGILLVDSGGQYLDGTTDITRTIALSAPTAQQKQDFTLVLKGNIALSLAKFPKGTTGAQLDILARQALWNHGCNYGHGTGHGIGHFLNVHEGPQRIHVNNYVPLELGMVCSNEPGLYRTDQYGIRIENTIVVVPAETTEFDTFYQFETVSLCPIDLDLIEASLLSQAERAWLNAYHQRVYDTLSPFLNKEECAWLRRETRAI